MQLQMRDLEWWMRRRQLPTRVRQRVRQFERQKWAATRGVDEAAMVSELPEVLRRDIKRHLCVDLVRQVQSSLSLQQTFNLTIGKVKISKLRT